MDKFLLQERKRSNSVCTEEELLKRKREPEPESPSNIFQKSKKTQRSPFKLKRNIEDMDVKILQMLEELSSDVKEIKRSNAELKEEFKNTQEDWKRERNEMKEEIKILANKIKLLEQNEEARKKAEKKCNIVINGINFKSENARELDEEINKFINTELKIKSDVSSSYKIANKNVYIAKCFSFAEKSSIMKNKYKLQGKKVFINNDYTKKEIEVQKKLKELAKEEQKKGKKTKIGYRKIQIDGKWKSWADIEDEI